MAALRASQGGTSETRLVRGFLPAVRADACAEAAALELEVAERLIDQQVEALYTGGS